MIKYIKKVGYVAVFAGFISLIISCENDFTDIGSNVITNTKFDTDAVFVDVTIENSPLEKVQSDNISRQLSQYLLGVYSNSNYEKLEASIVSQLTIASNLKVFKDTLTIKPNQSLITTIDTVFIKIPYQVRLANATDKSYELDSVFGDVSKAFNLNIYRSNTYINNFNPIDPTKINSYFSNDNFEKSGSALNAEFNFQLKPSKADTLMVIQRRSSDNTIFRTDNLRFTTSSASQIPVPFARIPLKKDVIKALFLDKYGSGEFASQQAFNDYFRGIILEASGDEGALLSLNFDNTNTVLRPTLEVYYTNTLIQTATAVIDSVFPSNDSFSMNGFKINKFKMGNKIYPMNNEIKVQGTAGSEATINIFGADLNNNGIADKIEELREKNWLINDATLTFYINQANDTTFAPDRLYLYKSDDSSGSQVTSQIKDAISEATFGGISGFLVRDSNGRKEKYTFKITDYVSDLLNGNTNYLPKLKLKTYNISDSPSTATDTIFRNYSWNPKAVTLFNQSSVNGDKKATLKISYSERKN
ncbi:MAG: DUF4270 domain-containing protein [Flavobacteriia bacterium]|nr:DUF4270 domain-containing protein [Flavobacteriia bacterium]OIP47729.1 MAG: hypothetical protein AUK46_04300 [Flavobacteriaceae bacterium CG2_30_31_66]PIV97420.1 MAG: hypothetical protein COW43_03270 [Flavobacteriaceae bacterium CG17_big_fil_post_rev_8_21_14_2_50_31_13]PIX11781.1 MAG: hypothetical protein COZ74_13090 [Flavobacteriaceae bacterium CG_4_8_14_3_um_filter_31_8]PIY14779.1 MAG: hypothetical protein COZ16_07510 [Flavobacteriaceae bacterium CG_4_10_14_3_um_filter_31_253]PIZ12127.1 M